MRTKSFRRAVPRPLRKIYRWVFPRPPALRNTVDAEARRRHVVLPLPTRHSAHRWSRARTSLSLEVPVDLWVAKALGEKGLANYEAEALSVFLALMQHSGKNAVFFDIGSNVGPFCLLAAALTKARVIAFEPAPQTAEALRSIRDTNGLSIAIEQIALGEKDGESQLYLSMKSDASNSLQAEFREWERSVTVTVQTLDGYCARAGVVPTVLKIDTESTEPAVLRGAHDLLSNERPPIICEVLPGRTERELEEIFTRYGYRGYAIGENGSLEEKATIEGDTGYRFRDWLFMPSPITPRFTRSVGRWHRSIRPDRAK